jgi:hypothetical protein
VPAESLAAPRYRRCACPTKTSRRSKSSRIANATMPAINRRGARDFVWELMRRQVRSEHHLTANCEEGALVIAEMYLRPQIRFSAHFSQIAQICSAGLQTGCTEGLPALSGPASPRSPGCRAVREKCRLVREPKRPFDVSRRAFSIGKKPMRRRFAWAYGRQNRRRRCRDNRAQGQRVPIDNWCCRRASQ